MKKFLNYSCFIIVFLIGIVDICYGITYESRQDNFFKNANKVVASIYETKNNEDGSQVLYINYYIKGKKYDNILVLEKGKNTNKSSIEILYSKNDPLNIMINQVDNEGYFIIFIGIIALTLDTCLIIKHYVESQSKK